MSRYAVAMLLLLTCYGGLSDSKPARLRSGLRRTVRKLDQLYYNRSSLSNRRSESDTLPEAAAITYNSHMGQTTVVLRVTHLTVGTHLAHFHTGKCGSNGAVKYPLTPLVGPGTKTSTTIFTGKLTGTLYINVHGTPKSAMQVVSCGDVK